MSPGAVPIGVRGRGTLPELRPCSFYSAPRGLRRFRGLKLGCDIIDEHSLWNRLRNVPPMLARLPTSPWTLKCRTGQGLKDRPGFPGRAGVDMMLEVETLQCGFLLRLLCLAP